MRGNCCQCQRCSKFYGKEKWAKFKHFKNNCDKGKWTYRFPRLSTKWKTAGDKLDEDGNYFCVFGCADEYTTVVDIAHHYLSSAHTTAQLKAFGICQTRLKRHYNPPIDAQLCDVTPLGDVLDEIYVEYHVKYEAEVSIAIAMADANPTLPPRTDLKNKR